MIYKVYTNSHEVIPRLRIKSTATSFTAVTATAIDQLLFAVFSPQYYITIIKSNLMNIIKSICLSSRGVLLALLLMHVWYSTAVVAMNAQHPPHGDWILTGGIQGSLRKSSYKNNQKRHYYYIHITISHLRIDNEPHRWDSLSVIDCGIWCWNDCHFLRADKFFWNPHA